MAEAGSLKVSAQGSRTELLLQGHPVIDSYAELRRALDTRVSSDTATLFAEPRRVANLGIAWFDPMGSQDSVPVTTLAGEAREQAEATLTRMFRELEALFADEKIGVLILAALNVDADDSIRVVGSRLVLVGWGGLSSGLAARAAPNVHHCGPGSAQPDAAAACGVETVGRGGQVLPGVSTHAQGRVFRRYPGDAAAAVPLLQGHRGQSPPRRVGQDREGLQDQ